MWCIVGSIRWPKFYRSDIVEKIFCITCDGVVGARELETKTKNQTPMHCARKLIYLNFRMLERDVGEYEAVASNEHGEARQRVRLEIAEYPRFIRRPEETFIMTRRNGRLEARVVGVPDPEVKWYKDWQPISESARIKVGRV